jgi:hypothetical protein
LLFAFHVLSFPGWTFELLMDWYSSLRAVGTCLQALFLSPALAISAHAHRKQQQQLYIFNFYASRNIPLVHKLDQQFQLALGVALNTITLLQLTPSPSSGQHVKLNMMNWYIKWWLLAMGAHSHEMLLHCESACSTSST